MDEPASKTQDLKKREEEKRDKAFTAAERWRHLQDTITWAEANLPPHLQRNRPRLRKSRMSPKRS